MGIDIENPGSEEGDLKAALSGLAGHVLLSSGEITTPVDFVELELPAEYSYFTFVFERFGLDDLGQLSYQFSDDDGATYHEGESDYSFSDYRSDASSGFIGTYGPDKMPVFASISTAGVESGSDGNLSIYPGEADKKATTRGFASSRGAAGTGSFFDMSSSHIEIVGRQNKIKVQPYYGIDFNIKLISGRYRLFGALTTP